MLADIVNPALLLATSTLLVGLLLFWSFRLVDKSVMSGRAIVLVETRVQLLRTAVLVALPAFVLLPFALACLVSLMAGAITSAPMLFALKTNKWRGLDLNYFAPVLNEVAIACMRRAGDDGEYLIDTKSIDEALQRRKFKANECTAIKRILHQHFVSIGYIQSSETKIDSFITTDGASDSSWVTNYVYCVEQRHFKRSFAW